MVARLGEMLVFIEVRYRKAASLVSAEESVTREKSRRIRMAVKQYIAVRGVREETPMRIDLCVVRDQGQLFEIVPGIIEFR